MAFINELKRRNVSHQLGAYRDDGLMVSVAVAGERWEVEFLLDGTLAIERFRTDGQLRGAEELDELWELCD